MVTLDKVYHAAFILKSVARKTDLIEAPKLSDDYTLYLKTNTARSDDMIRIALRLIWVIILMRTGRCIFQ